MIFIMNIKMDSIYHSYRYYYVSDNNILFEAYTIDKRQDIEFFMKKNNSILFLINNAANKFYQ